MVMGLTGLGLYKKKLITVQADIMTDLNGVSQKKWPVLGFAESSSMPSYVLFIYNVLFIYI
jgi:hypothetical protein